MDKRTRVLTTAGIMVGMMVAALDQTIVDTAFPRMIAELHGESIFTWVLTIYMLASTAIVPVVGKLADIYGRKIFYLAGMILFVGGSLLCGAAQDMLQLILFRAIQGIGAGMVMPIAFTIIGDIFPAEQRAKMQGLFGGVWGLASIMGPKLGGWITHHYSWRYIFYINLPIGLIAVALMILGYRESRGERRPIDWAGAATVTGGIMAFLLAMAQAEAWGWGSPLIIGLLVAALVLLVTFGFIETRVPEPILDLKLFRNRTFSVMSAIGFLMGAGMFGCIIFVPWFIQGVVGVNPDEAGSVMTPMMLTMVVSSILAGRLALKFPYRYQITVGFGLVAVGFYLMTGWTVETTKLTATLNSMVVGAGLGQIMPIMTLAVQNAFPANRRGVVTSAATFFRQVGATVGITGFGVIFNTQFAANFREQLAPGLEQMRPMLAQLPAVAQEMFAKVFEEPQILVRILLSEEAQRALPETIRPQLLGATKLIMAESLHLVFWTGLAVVVLGAVVVQFLGGTNLKQQAAEQGTAPHLESTIAAD